MRAIDLKPREQYFFIKAFTTFSLCHFGKIFRCSRYPDPDNFATKRRIVSHIDTESFINEKGKIDRRRNTVTTGSQTTIAMISDKKEDFDLSSEEMCNDVALSGFVLSYFVSRRGRLLSCLPILLRIGSDYQPRWSALSREMRVSIATNRRRNGIGGNDERCNTSYTLTFCPPFSRYPRVRPICPFLDLTYDPASLFRLSLAQNNFMPE